MKDLFLIFLGGGAGSLLRYFLSIFIQGFFSLSFPVGTLGVNILACFILGLIVGSADSIVSLSPVSRYLLITGFCGGFSTFSAFSYESVQLMQEGRYFYLGMYIILSIVFCFLAVFTGVFMGAKIS